MDADVVDEASMLFRLMISHKTENQYEHQLVEFVVGAIRESKSREEDRNKSDTLSSATEEEITSADCDGTGFVFPNFSNALCTPSAMSCIFSASVLIDGKDELEGRSGISLPSACSAWYF
jgi:hypothetical protein